VSNAKLLIPLRIPELGPSLGKLITGTGRVLDGITVEPFRCQLATKIIELAGESRRLAANDERAAALATLGREGWLGVWNETVTAVADELVDRIETHLDAEARAVGMPERRRLKLMLEPAERRALAARLGSAGAGFIPVLDDLESESTALLEATALQREALERWQADLVLAARSLEAAWLAMEVGVGDEISRWRAVFDDVASWRKPWWPLVIVATIALAAAVWLGLILGGVLPPPSWLAGVWG
jgi:hypothetical protein